MKNLKGKLTFIIVLIGIVLVAIFNHGLTQNTPLSSHEQPTTNTEPVIVSTNPSPLENAVILPTQTIELTFNYPIVNKDELKNKLDPDIKNFKVELSEDRKTAKLVPTKPYNLGSGYTLFIQPGTKFDGGKVTKQDFIYHFRTIDYHGV